MGTTQKQMSRGLWLVVMGLLSALVPARSVVWSATADLPPSQINQGARIGQQPSPTSSGADDSAHIRLANGVQTDAFDDVIHRAYDRLAEASTEPIRFEVQELRTLDRKALSTLRLRDVSTLPSGELLKATRRAPTGEALSMTLEWIDVGGSHELTPGGQEVSNWTLDQILEKNQEVDPLLARVEYLTTYRVRVNYQDRQRLYRALFLWLDDGQGGFAPTPVDHVIQGLDLVVRNLNEPKSDEQEIESRIDFEHSPTINRRTAAATSCVANEFHPAWAGDQLQLHSDHVLGDGPSWHGISWGIHFNCSCSGDCSQECGISPHALLNECKEIGPTGTCHKMSEPSLAFSHGMSRPGLPPASCKFGIGCAWKKCVGCLCGSASINVGYTNTFGGAGVQLSIMAAEGTAITLEQPYWCPPCEETADSTGTGGDGGDTNDDGTAQPWQPPASPLVIDLDRGGFSFTNLESGVVFDMAGTGDRRRVAWIDAASGDGFLVLDRDANGTIDSGKELFGDKSWQFESDEPNGFASLSVFDRVDQGGNEDGWIDADDAIFRHLQIWVDSNHDGISQPEELRSLSDAGVMAIELRYRRSERKDRHGNELRFQGKVVLERGTTQMIDVFFLTE